MSDAGSDSRVSDGRIGVAASAGALLRQARQAQGLHIAALAAAMKVTPAKLEALETDRFEQLPDATFTRGLAQSVCRHLKIDPAPVLALLPPPNGHRLEQVAQGLRTPFRERHGRLSTSERAVHWSSVAVWGPLLLLVAAAVVYFLPVPVFDRAAAERRLAAGDAASAATTAAGTTVVELPPPLLELPTGAGPAAGDSAEPAPQATAASTAAAATAAASALAEPAAGAAVQVSAGVSVDSWVEVVDARGQALVYRTLKGGETVAVDGNMPFKVKIGNARTARLTWRGQAVDLKPSTNRDDVARLELK